ncbi:MAG TPA: methyltransferase domain-containing protein [Stellaceae bacterium]|nr:methyltransferase domain-containing protein [Stellaceae bacterium]
MPMLVERIAYRAAQRLRVSWYFGQKWLSARLTDDMPAPPELKERMPDRARILADLRALLDQDWRNIEQGLYRLPEGGVDPVAALRKAGRYFADLRQVNARRRADANDEVFRETPPGRYPRYYLQNFHYQTDGWLSRRSAELYDHQVEVLFGCGADAMRRQALVPLGRVLAERGVRNAALLDLACGTGRFLREVKTNYPKLAVTALDLSPHYLELAREALAPWSGATFLEAPAEAVPAADASFDAVTCIFLFHELPGKTRRQVVAEMARLLRPGGAAIIVDSIQLGDVPEYDALVEYFPHAFHEPYYAQYALEDLAATFAAAGLTLVESRVAYFAKVMTFRKPG